MNNDTSIATVAFKPSDGTVIVSPYSNLDLRDYIIKFEETYPIEVPLHIIIK